MQFKITNNAPQRGIVFINRFQGAVEGSNSVNIFRNPQKVCPSLKLEDFNDLREIGETFQIETSSTSYGSLEEESLEVLLHFFVLKDVWNARISFSFFYHCRDFRLEDTWKVKMRNVENEEFGNDGGEQLKLTLVY